VGRHALGTCSHYGSPITRVGGEILLPIGLARRPAWHCSEIYRATRDGLPMPDFLANRGRQLPPGAARPLQRPAATRDEHGPYRLATSGAGAITIIAVRTRHDPQGDMRRACRAGAGCGSSRDVAGLKAEAMTEFQRSRFRMLLMAVVQPASASWRATNNSGGFHLGGVGAPCRCKRAAKA
jgi:hypothetical protein